MNRRRPARIDHKALTCRGSEPIARALVESNPPVLPYALEVLADGDGP